MHYHVTVLFDSTYFSFLSLSVIRTALHFHWIDFELPSCYIIPTQIPRCCQLCNSNKVSSTCSATLQNSLESFSPKFDFGSKRWKRSLSKAFIPSSPYCFRLDSTSLSSVRVLLPGVRAQLPQIRVGGSIGFPPTLGSTAYLVVLNLHIYVYLGIILPVCTLCHFIRSTCRP